MLTLSPSNIEKYLAAAETILNEAYPESAESLKKGQKPLAQFGGTKRAVGENSVSERHREKLREMGLLDKLDDPIAKLKDTRDTKHIEVIRPVARPAQSRVVDERTRAAMIRIEGERG